MIFSIPSQLSSKTTLATWGKYLCTNLLCNNNNNILIFTDELIFWRWFFSCCIWSSSLLLLLICQRCQHTRHHRCPRCLYSRVALWTPNSLFTVVNKTTSSLPSPPSTSSFLLPPPCLSISSFYRCFTIPSFCSKVSRELQMEQKFETKIDSVPISLSVSS